MKYDYASAPKALTPCPLCGQTSFETLACVDRYTMGISTVGCRACGLIQTNPRLTAEGLNDFYRWSYREFYQGVTQPSEVYVQANQKDVRLAQTVAFLRAAAVVEESGVVLDVGCSEGSLFSAMRKANFDGTLVGIEPNAEFRVYAASRYGATVYPTEFELPDSFKHGVDLIVINHVLEHLIDPVASLRHLRRFVKPAGHVYVDVPDAERYASVNDLHLAHIYHFTTTSLGATLIAGEFDIVSIERHQPIGHPPSLRAIARPRRAAAPFAPERTLIDDGAERTAWPQLTRINRQRHSIALRRFLRRSAALVSLYGKARTFVRR